MQDIPPIEQLPQLKGRCKAIAIVLAFLLLFLPFFIAIFIWSEYEDISITTGIFLFLEIVSSIITANMRAYATPKDQGEISFTTYEIATWYTAKKYIGCK